MISMSAKFTKTLVGKILVHLFICFGYIALGWISLKLATINDSASPIWSPSGFAIGCMIIFGRRFAPAVFLGATITNMFVNTHFMGSAIIGFGNMLEAIAGATLVTYMLQSKIFKNYSEFYSVLFAAIFATVISASIGSTYLVMDGLIESGDLIYSWYTWWSGDAVGILIVVPFFLEIRHLDHLKDLTLKKLSLATFFTAVFFSVIYLVFVDGYNLAFAWSLTPVLILAGFTVGHLISRMVVIVLTLFVVVLTSKGYSPYDYGNLNLNLIYAQSLLTSYAFAILFVRPFVTGFKVSQRFIWGNIAAWAGLFFIIFITFKYERNYTREDLQRSIKAASDSLDRSLSQVDLLMSSASSLASQNSDITQTEWTNFVESMRLDVRHSELNTLGIVYPLKKSELSQSIARLNQRGSQIKEIHNVGKEDHPDIFLISFAAPESNKFAMGWDLGSEKIRRKAAETARDLNQTTSTEPIDLIQTNERGLVIFHPIFRGKDEFVGWVYTTTNLKTFFGDRLQEFGHLLRMKVYSGEKLIFNMDNYPKDVYKNHSHKVERNLNVFGQDFRLEFYPTAQFFTRHSGYSAILALLMNLFMLFIAGFLLDQITFGQRAEALVMERTKQLEQSKAQLINSSKMASLGEMASGMAHEINNPLTIILGKIKIITMMMEESGLNSPIINEEMKKMQSTTERIGKIVKGLRSFSRASESDPFELVPVDAIVQETLDLCLEKFKAKGINVKVGSVPDLMLNCRPSQISQVLLNLLNNAHDALGNSSQNNCWIKVEFGIKPGNHMEISVMDSGLGISREISDKIMEPFFTTKGVGKGTGLGLSIAKGIIEDHGGKIWYDQTSSHTRFVIELPYQRA